MRLRIGGEDLLPVVGCWRSEVVGVTKGRDDGLVRHFGGGLVVRCRGLRGVEGEVSLCA